MIMSKKLPSQKELLNSFIYNPDTGNLYHLKSMQIADSVLGKTHKRLRVTFNNERYLSHRIIWKMVYGRDPKNQIDHINNCALDNRLCNLREATHQENCCNFSKQTNNATGYKGVHFSKLRNYWYWQIMNNGISYSKSGFLTKEEAFESRCAFGKQLHGDFYNAGGVSLV
jgi:hypothetical protein